MILVLNYWINSEIITPELNAIGLTTMKIITVLIVLGLLLVIVGAVIIQLFNHSAHVLLAKPDHQSS
jgi:hypothetical protein